MPISERPTSLTVILGSVLSLGSCLAAAQFVAFPTQSSRGTEQPLAAQIEAVRGNVSDTICVGTRAVSDAQFRGLVSLPGLRVLQIDAGRISDAALADLPADLEVEHLRLRNSAIGDNGMRGIARLKHLRVLNLPDAQFSDQGLRQVAKLPSLELLRFASPNVTDDGLAALRSTRSLRFLHIVAAPLTDAALAHVAEMSELQSFYVDATRITDEGLSQLVRQRPDLHIHVRQQHVDSDAKSQHHSHENP